MSNIQNVSQLLIQLGLSENETKVFLSSVRLGASQISKVARDAKIARTYVYEIAEELKVKGLLTEIEVRGVKKLEAISHAGLLAYIERRQKELLDLEKKFVKAASEFNALVVGTQQKTKVRFFEGVEGIKSINDEISSDLQRQRNPYTFRVIFSADKMETVLPGWVEHNDHIYFEPMMNKRAIISETPMLSEFLKQVQKNQQKNFHYKIWPKGEKEFPTDTLQWLNKIAYLDMRDYPSGIIIDSEAIVETFIMWFEQMWQGLSTDSGNGFVFLGREPDLYSTDDLRK